MALPLSPRRHLRLVQQDERGVRPATRGDCEGVARPCPWRECRYHLDPVRLEKSERRERRRDPEMSCALDVADEGGARLETVGRALGVTRERARQIEETALRKLGIRPGELGAWNEGGGRRPELRSRGLSRAVNEVKAAPPDERGLDIDLRGLDAMGWRERDEDDVEPSFFHDSDGWDGASFDEIDRADRLVCASVWRMFVRDSNSHGFDARSRQSKQATKALTDAGRQFNRPPRREP